MEAFRVMDGGRVVATFDDLQEAKRFADSHVGYYATNTVWSVRGTFEVYRSAER